MTKRLLALVIASVWCTFLTAQSFNAVSFPTNADYINTDWDPTFGADQDFSIDFLIRTDGWSSDPAIISDKDWASGGNPGFNIALGGNGSGIDVNVGDGGNRADLLSGTINDGIWHHVLVSFDRDGNLSMYIDGVLTEETDLSGVGDINSPDAFKLGQDGTGNYSGSATADLAQVRVWNAVLTPENIEDVICMDIMMGHPFFDNLAHSWKMDEGTGTTVADAIAGNNGTFVGAPTWVTGELPVCSEVQGEDFNAVAFPSNADYINTDWDPTFNTDQDFSIDFRVRTDGWSSDPSIISDKDWASGGNPGFNIALGGNGSGIDVNVGDGGNRADLLSGTINDGLWHHVLVSFDRDGNLSMYIDGALTEETDLSGVGDINSPNTFKLGQDGTGNYSGSATAELSQVRIWNAVLTPENIEDIVCSDIMMGHPFFNNLIHHWPINEGSGNTVADAIGGNNGSFEGMPLWVEGELFTPMADFDFTVNNAFVTFADMSVGANSYSWDFGNGETSTEANPSATYATVGTYDVSLTISNLCGSSTITKQVEITNVTCDPITNLAVEATGSNAGRVSWASGGFGVYNVEYGTAGFTPGMGTLVEGIMDTAYTIRGLMSETAYDVYVQQVCGNLTSDFAGPVGFTTNVKTTEAGYGNALSFDGTAGSLFLSPSGNTTSATALDMPQSAFTITAWVNLNGFNDYAGILSFMQDNGSFERGFILQTRPGGGGTVLLSLVTEEGPALSYNTDNGINNFPTGEWAHVAATYDGSQVDMYLNGALVKSFDEDGGDVLYADSWLVIGQYKDDNENYYLDGQVDDVALYNRALSQEEILQVQCQKFDNVSEGLLSYYPMAEGAGTVVSDCAGVLNGELFNGAWSTSLTTPADCIQDPGIDSDFNAVGFTANTDYINTEWTPEFGTDQDFSIEFRFRTDGVESDPSLISNKNWASGGNPGFNIALNSGGENVDVNVGDGTNRADLDAGNVADGDWHHFLVTFDRDGEMTMYIDGALTQSTDMSGVGDLTTANTFKIGQDGTGAYPAAATVEMSDIRVWGKVLPLEESAAFRCNTIDNTHPSWDDLLHYWILNEGAPATEVADSKGSNNGTFVGALFWTTGNNFPSAVASFSEVISLSNLEFVNASTSGVYSWDFGDGTTSDLSDPVHLYTATGTYEVQLIVNRACDSDTITRSIEITDLDPNLLTSLDFDGTDDLVELNNDLNFGTDGDFTIELFVRSAGWNSDPAIIANKDWNSGGNPGFIIAGRSDGQTWKFNIGDGGNRIDMDGGVIADNSWHHIAVSFDRDGNKQLIQDGAVVAENNTAFLGNIDNDLALAIGQDGTLNYGAYFRGQVAEVRIWNVALDSATIVDNKCGTEDHPFAADLLHYWKGNEGEGTVVEDLAGDNDGTYNGEWATSVNDIEGCEPPIPSNDIGAGNALDFDGFDDFVNVTKNDIFEIPNSITLEGWVLIRSFDQWESFLNYVQDNGSNESGFDFAFVDGKLRFRVMTTEMSGNDWNDNPGAVIPVNQWVHVAGTYDGSVMKMYLNGVLMEEEEKSGPIDWEFKPLELRIGSYIDDNELYYWDGRVDEVRIWDIARTEEEIRESMCVRLEGNEEGLVAYYRLDELAGTTVVDLGPNGLNGALGATMSPSQDRVLSGAGIGDESAYIYPENWDGTTLALGSTDQGDLSISNVINDPAGIQVYRVDSTPNSTEGITPLPNTDAYYGVVVADGISSTFDLAIDYTNNPDAVADEANLLMAVRQSSDALIWTNVLADVDVDANAVIKTSLGGRREVVLGTSTGSTCPFPTDVITDEVTFSTIGFSWTSASGTSNLEFGPAGFILGEGTLIEDAGQSFLLEDLATESAFDFYLQDACADGETSTWVGPFSFSTSRCIEPSEVVASYNAVGDTVTFEWINSENATAVNIEWGPRGTDLGLGILIDSVQAPHVFTGFPTGLDLSYYIQSICGTAGVSDWVGPFDILVNTDEALQINTFSIFPNPTNGLLNLWLESPVLESADLQIVNILGEVVYTKVLNLNRVLYQDQFDLSNFAAGTYFLIIKSDKGTATKRVVLK